MITGIKEEINVSKLTFDPENPRLPFDLQGKRDEEKVIEYMIKSGNVTELMCSMAELGYTDAEPLLVVKDKDDSYLVVEGNRRLAAIKLLNNPDLAKIRTEAIKGIVQNATVIPADIPCIIYSKRNDILDYLGYRHITGVKEWGALEKAIYLNMLYETHKNDELSDDEIYRKLAQMIGSRMDYVRKLHMSYKLYSLASENEFYGIDDYDDISFSWITASLGYSEIQDFIGIGDSEYTISNLNNDNFEKIFKWLFNKNLVSESRNIKKLAMVIGSEKAIEKLEAGFSLDEALLYSSHPEDAFLQLLKDSRDKLRKAISQIEPLKEKPEETDEVLADINKLVTSIQGALQANFGDFLQGILANNNLSVNDLMEYLKTKSEN